MERLGDFVDSLTQSLSEEQDGAVGEEFCELAIGIGHLRDAVKESQDKTEESDEEHDILAIAWRVEYDLTQLAG